MSPSSAPSRDISTLLQPHVQTRGARVHALAPRAHLPWLAAALRTAIRPHSTFWQSLPFHLAPPRMPSPPQQPSPAPAPAPAQESGQPPAPRTGDEMPSSNELLDIGAKSLQTGVLTGMYRGSAQLRPSLPPSELLNNPRHPRRRYRRRIRHYAERTPCAVRIVRWPSVVRAGIQLYG